MNPVLVAGSLSRASGRLPAVFVRGGTSKAVVFKACDLPVERALRDRIFCHVLGSPDPYGRQLDGLGGGLSSLSKVVIVSPSTRLDADVDYTFVQVAVGQPVADYGGLCGNMSAAVGPFAVDEGMVAAGGNTATVRVYNTNTAKLYGATFPVENGRSVETGDFEIPGVSGAGAKISLQYFDPGGAVTGALLPSGGALDRLEIEGFGEIEASLVDASNPVVFVRASDLGRTALEGASELDTDGDLMRLLEQVRRVAAVSMGLSEKPESAGLSTPKVAIIGPPGSFVALDGRSYGTRDFDIAIRIVSMGNVHRAVTLTGAMCLAAAARIPGTIPHEVAAASDSTRIGNPSGVLPVAADVRVEQGQIEVVSTTTYRTQRRLMEGWVRVPKTLLGSEV